MSLSIYVHEDVKKKLLVINRHCYYYDLVEKTYVLYSIFGHNLVYNFISMIILLSKAWNANDFFRDRSGLCRLECNISAIALFLFLARSDNQVEKKRENKTRKGREKPKEGRWLYNLLRQLKKCNKYIILANFKGKSYSGGHIWTFHLSASLSQIRCVYDNEANIRNFS